MHVAVHTASVLSLEEVFVWERWQLLLNKMEVLFDEVHLTVGLTLRHRWMIVH